MPPGWFLAQYYLSIADYWRFMVWHLLCSKVISVFWFDKMPVGKPWDGKKEAKVCFIPPLLCLGHWG